MNWTRMSFRGELLNNILVSFVTNSQGMGDRAYVVPKDLTTLNSKRNFEKAIEEWMRGQVAYYKYLRGGEQHELTFRNCSLRLL